MATGNFCSITIISYSGMGAGEATFCNEFSRSKDQNLSLNFMSCGGSRVEIIALCFTGCVVNDCPRNLLGRLTLSLALR